MLDLIRTPFSRAGSWFSLAVRGAPSGAGETGVLVPRSTIRVKNAPTHFGSAAFEIVSEADNRKPSTEFNPEKEVITLKGLAGTVAVTARY
jgi:hypothetical protein